LLEYLQEMFIRVRTQEEGQALVEYALILALISVVAIGALTAIGVNVLAILTSVAAAL
jgi:pilus assembly protein Flp/PilA